MPDRSPPRARALELRLVVPPLHGAREPRDLRGIEAERLADVAQRAARAIADDRRGERGAVAPYLP
jgi:hypothetical protein